MGGGGNNTFGYAPFHDAVPVLLCDHEEGVGLAVGRAVRAEVVHPQTVHNSDKNTVLFLGNR